MGLSADSDSQSHMYADAEMSSDYRHLTVMGTVFRFLPTGL